jgi:hypothetical protein
MPVLGESRMVGHAAIKAKAAEPPIGQIEVNLFAEAPFRSNAKTIAHDQHSDHKLWVNRRTACRAVEIGQFPPQTSKLDEPVDGAQQMISWNVPLQRKLIEQSSLFDLAMAHHDSQSCLSQRLNQ